MRCKLIAAALLLFCTLLSPLAARASVGDLPITRTNLKGITEAYLLLSIDPDLSDPGLADQVKAPIKNGCLTLISKDRMLGQDLPTLLEVRVGVIPLPDGRFIYSIDVSVDWILRPEEEGEAPSLVEVWSSTGTFGIGSKASIEKSVTEQMAQFKAAWQAVNLTESAARP